MFKNIFSFRGRIRRLEYCISYLLYFFFLLAIGKFSHEISNFLNILYFPLIYLIIAQGSKRCHDIGRKGWWQFIPFFIFLLLFSEGDNERNEYGENPKKHKL